MGEGSIRKPFSKSLLACLDSLCLLCGGSLFLDMILKMFSAWVLFLPAAFNWFRF
jgi:hypothetical protein